MEGQETSRFNFNKIFEYCILALVFLVPVIFVPVLSVSLYSAKIVFVATVIVAFIATFLASTLSTGRIVLPKSRFLIPMIAFPVIAIISSLFSGELAKSTMGVIFDLGTTGSIVILSLVFFVSMFAAKDNSSIGMKSLYALSAASLIVILHALLRIFGSSIPSSIASRMPDFLVGGPIDTSIMLAVFSLVAMTMLTSNFLSRNARYAFYVLMAISLLFIGAIGFTATIITLGIFALIYFVYTFSWSVSSEGSGRMMSSSPSLIVLVISVVFILSGSSLSGYLSNILKVNTVEVRPNWEVTMNMVGGAWKKNPVVGIGPNMFKELWDMSKPIDINATQFWSAEFNFGSGFIPTMAATTGVLGIASLLVFLFFYARAGFKAIFISSSDEKYRYVSTTSFLASLFLWIMAFMYVPSIALLVIMFALTGIFTATLVPLNVVQSIDINIFRNPKSNFASVFVIVVFLLASIAGGYFVWERAVAASIFQNGDSSGALRMVNTDIYWRGYSEKSLNSITGIVSSVSSPNDFTEAQRVSVQSAIADAIAGANQAINWNRKDFRNWFALGRVYEVLANNGIQGAKESAEAAFKEAETRSPQNPAIPLAYARLAAIGGDKDMAKEYISKAVSLKSNYSDAYFTLAQIEAASNNITGAIQGVEAATLVDPQNPALYFQLGLLKYNNSDYRGAASAFEQSIRLVGDYANARYFLGLSYERIGRDADAIIQFEAIQKTNPDNSEVALIIKNLKDGRSPFSNAQPPIDDKPEKRAELPIEESR